jgi:hypothetical protein
LLTAGLSLSFPGVAARCKAVTISWSALLTFALPSLIRIYQIQQNNYTFPNPAPLFIGFMHGLRIRVSIWIGVYQS